MTTTLGPARERQLVLPPPASTPPTLMIGKNAWLYVVLAVTALFAVRLRNTAFIDEALYINAGKDYLAHWFGGAHLPADTGNLFSGVPVLYPVLAGALDNVGGLYLVRAFSLLCVLGTAVLIQRTTRAMFGGQSGTLAAAAFCFTGSVIFVGWFATFDALCILLLAAGAYIGVTRHGTRSAALMGLVLALAIAVKYTAILFVPVMLAVMVLANSSARWRRLGIAVATLATSLAVPYLLWGHHIREDISYTTTGREAMSPAAPGDMILAMWGGIGLLLILGAIGASGLMASRRPRAIMLGGGLVLAALALPASQIYMGEGVSFEKHFAYTALCISPLAGWTLARIRAIPLASALATMLVLILLVIGGFRSLELYRSWLSVEPAMDFIAEEPIGGLYLSSLRERPLSYHTRDTYPDIRWELPYDIFANPEAIADVVAEGRFQRVIIWNESTGSPPHDIGQAALIKALNASDIYELRAPSGDEADKWLFYTIVTEGQ